MPSPSLYNWIDIKPKTKIFGFGYYNIHVVYFSFGYELLNNFIKNLLKSNAFTNNFKGLLNNMNTTKAPELLVYT